jgi:SM-20-related protein
VFRRLGMEPFPVGRVEVQLTASNDGEYFKTHNDNTHNALRSRKLTFVYYFHVEPKAFTGGELRLYDPRLINGQYIAEPTFREVAPRQNQMVFFSSHLMHEVRPVSCSSQRLQDSRFTVNGWLHKT